MVLHLLAAYHQHDEEIESIHLPISFAAILEFLLVGSDTVVVETLFSDL